MRAIVDPDKLVNREMSVSLGGRQAAVAEKLLNRPKVGPPLQHVGSATMTQNVGVHLNDPNLASHSVAPSAAPNDGNSTTKSR